MGWFPFVSCIWSCDAVGSERRVLFGEVRNSGGIMNKQQQKQISTADTAIKANITEANKSGYCDEGPFENVNIEYNVSDGRWVVCLRTALDYEFNGYGYTLQDAIASALTNVVENWKE